MSDNSRCGGCATAVMNLSVTFLGRPDTDEIVLSVAESLVVFSMALCFAEHANI